MLYHPYVEASLKLYHFLWLCEFISIRWLRVNIKRCLLCCNLSAVRWFSTSHPPWIASSGASSRLAFFRTVRPLTGIVSHYRESMLSMPEDRCAHYEWSGALITAIVRESWELNLHQSSREAAVSVWICVNTREHSVTKTPNEFLLRILHILTCILNLNKCLWCCRCDDWDCLTSHCC